MRGGGVIYDPPPLSKNRFHQKTVRDTTMKFCDFSWLLRPKMTTKIFLGSGGPECPKSKKQCHSMRGGSYMTPHWGSSFCPRTKFFIPKRIYAKNKKCRIKVWTLYLLPLFGKNRKTEIFEISEKKFCVRNFFFELFRSCPKVVKWVQNVFQTTPLDL